MGFGPELDFLGANFDLCSDCSTLLTISLADASGSLGSDASVLDFVFDCDHAWLAVLFCKCLRDVSRGHRRRGESRLWCRPLVESESAWVEAFDRRRAPPLAQQAQTQLALLLLHALVHEDCAVVLALDAGARLQPMVPVHVCQDNRGEHVTLVHIIDHLAVFLVNFVDHGSDGALANATRSRHRLDRLVRWLVVDGLKTFRDLQSSDMRRWLGPPSRGPWAAQGGSPTLAHVPGHAARIDAVMYFG